MTECVCPGLPTELPLEMRAEIAGHLAVDVMLAINSKTPNKSCSGEEVFPDIKPVIYRANVTVILPGVEREIMFTKYICDQPYNLTIDGQMTDANVIFDLPTVIDGVVPRSARAYLTASADIFTRYCTNVGSPMLKAAVNPEEASLLRLRRAQLAVEHIDHHTRHRTLPRGVDTKHQPPGQPRFQRSLPTNGKKYDTVKFALEIASREQALLQNYDGSFGQFRLDVTSEIAAILTGQDRAYLHKAKTFRLTAVAYAALSRAISLVHADPKSIELAMNWMLRRQDRSSGCWLPVSRDPSETKVVVTAAILIGLLNADRHKTVVGSRHIDRGFVCLKDAIARGDLSTFEKAIANYAAALGGRKTVSTFLRENLLNEAVSKNHTINWLTDEEQVSRAIETSSYFVLAAVMDSNSKFFRLLSLKIGHTYLLIPNWTYLQTTHI